MRIFSEGNYFRFGLFFTIVKEVRVYGQHVKENLYTNLQWEGGREGVREEGMEVVTIHIIILLPTSSSSATHLPLLVIIVILNPTRMLEINAKLPMIIIICHLTNSTLPTSLVPLPTLHLKYSSTDFMQLTDCWLGEADS